MRKAFILCVLLTGCYNPPAYKTPAEQIVESCSESHVLGTPENRDCIQSASRAYEKEQEESRAQMERNIKVIAEVNEQRRKEQLKADGQQCVEYGFKKATPGFADCMLKISQARQQAAQQEISSDYQQQQIALQQEQLRLQKLQYITQSAPPQKNPLHLELNPISTRGNRINCTSMDMGGGLKTINCH
jgi:hypothetical protein